MNNNYKKLKSIVFSMVLAVGMLLPARGFAQTTEAETGGGLFRFGKLFNSEELFPDLVEEEPNADWTQGNDGLFGGYEEPTNNRSLFGKGGSLFEGLSLQNFGGGGDGLTLQNFGEEAPLGSGWLVLMGAGLGYGALKSRKKQNTRKK